MLLTPYISPDEDYMVFTNKIDLTFMGITNIEPINIRDKSTRFNQPINFNCVNKPYNLKA